jgi:uroporphyrinogen-III synthase
MVTTTSQPTIAIMRPSRYEQDSIQICKEAGFQVISAPMIEILDKKDEYFEHFVSRVLTGTTDVVIFTSANGIDHTLNKIQNRDTFIAALNRRKVIAIGPKTRDAAQNHGITIAFMPGSYSSESLVEAIKHDVRGKVVDIARSSHGAPVLIEGLKTAGACVSETQVYEITRPKRNKKQETLIRGLIDGTIDAIVFTSSMMVNNFFELAFLMGVKDQVTAALNSERIIVGSIGHPTAHRLNTYKIYINVVPDEYTFNALIDEVRKEFDTVR